MKIDIEMMKVPAVKLNDTQRKILENMTDKDFMLRLTVLSRRLKVPVSTLYTAWQKLDEIADVTITVTIKKKV